MTAKSQIELFKPEQMPNSEPQPIDTTSCPTIGNTFVSCCSGLYEKMVEYASYLVRNKRSHIEPMDLVHDLIITTELTDANFRNKIYWALFGEIQNSFSTTLYNEYKPKKSFIELYPCKYCHESLPIDCFRKMLNNQNRQRIYTSCKKCESINAVKRRKKSDAKSPLTASQKYFLKKKQTDPLFLKKKVQQMKEYRQRKKELSNNYDAKSSS